LVCTIGVKLFVTLLSDLHLEFWGGSERKHLEEFKISKDMPLIIPGDLTTFRTPSYSRWEPETILDYLCDQAPMVIYLPGNHEYYKAVSTAYVDDRISEIESELTNLKVLRTNEVFLYEDKRFIGDTMWFPNIPEVEINKGCINDTFLIKDLLPWAYNKNTDFRNWVSKECRKGDIVITHHLPTNECQPVQFRNHETSPYFVSDMKDIITANEPSVWIFGHTHSRRDFTEHNTRLLCNAIGYPLELYNEEYPKSEFEI